MDGQRFFIKGRVFDADDAEFQDALNAIYDTPERPRCMCVRGGVEMYVAKHRLFVVKRMPDTGSKHAPSCPSYESEAHQSGLGELMREAVIEHTPDSIELRVDFPLTRTIGRAVTPSERQEPAEVSAPKRRMSLRAVMHYLFERAQLNRWSPAMEGKRNQGVLHKYLTEAASGIKLKGLPLSDRLYVPEPFSEAYKSKVAERRRNKLAVLGNNGEGGATNMALILGEYKYSEEMTSGRKVWIKHMPDAPLFVEAKAWTRIIKVFGRQLEAKDADIAAKPRVVICALVFAKREHTYQIDTASFMLTTNQWIPVSGVEEIDLIEALIAQKRRFLKPLQYDAKYAAAFPNVLLLDGGDEPVALHVTSNFMTELERSTKDKLLKSAENGQWVWNTGDAMPHFPKVAWPAAASVRPAIGVPDDFRLLPPS